MPGKVRIGVIGTSWWADMMHLPSLCSHPQAQVVAICGRNRDRAEELATRFGIPQVFAGYRELIDLGHLEAVVVATPDDLHYPMAMHALDAGLHVLCEKPLAGNTAQARELVAKAEAAGVRHMTMFTWRWMPHFRYLHSLIAGGYIGRPYHCHFSFLRGSGRDGEYQWQWDRQRANGILGGLGSHMIDLARWYVGDITAVTAQLAAKIQRPGVDGHPLAAANDWAHLTVEFAGGAHGTIHASAVAHIADRVIEQHLAFYGEKGTLLADVVFLGPEAGAVIRGARHDEESLQVLPVPDQLWEGVDRSAFLSAMVPGVFMAQAAGPRLFVDAILAGRPVVPSFWEGLRAQEVIDAALESAHRGCTVPV